MERPFIIMRQDKAGYLDGKRREFAEGEVYQVDETLAKAFVHDLKIADPFDPRRPDPGKVVATDPQAAAETEGDSGAAETETETQGKDTGAPRRRGRKRRGAG